MSDAINPNATATGTATSSSSRVALPARGAGALCDIVNRGAATLFFKFGDVSVTAAVTDVPVQPGATIQYRRRGQDTHIAAITAGGSAAYTVVVGD